MIVLFSDFGLKGPYVGQMKAAVLREAPQATLIDLMHDAPRCDPKASAYLLAACAESFPRGTTFLCIVDPGVGGDRRPGILEADGQRFVGPDNGLFELVIRRSQVPPVWREILWRPGYLSPSFHGRDLFAPVAGRLAMNLAVPTDVRPLSGIRRLNWPDDLPEVIYIDDFGNAVTGLRARTLPPEAPLRLGGITLPRVRTFCDIRPGMPFCYENSSGLLEIAVNTGSAESAFGLALGTPVTASIM